MFCSELWLLWALATLTWSSGLSDNCAFTQSPQSVIVNSGEAVTLNCSYLSNITLTSWDKGTNHIAVHVPYPCSCQTLANGALFFPRVSDGDFDVYSCSVQVGPGVPCSRNATITKAAPPTLIPVTNTSQTVLVGGNATFSVNLADPGLPVASVVWTKDGVSLSNSINIVITSTMLQISNVQVGDRGQYVAMATNKAGSSNISFSLFVQYLDLVIAPIQISGSSSVQLTCTVHSYPAVLSITWSQKESGFLQNTTSTVQSDPYSFTSSNAVMVNSDCTQYYHCVVQSSARSDDQQTPACIGTVLNLQPVGMDSVLLMWNMVLGTTSYSITYQPGGTTPRTISCQTTFCNTTIEGLTAWTKYKFELGYAGLKVSSSITIGTGLSNITNVTVSQTGVVSWNALPEAIGYLVYVNRGTPGAYILNVTSGTMTTITGSCSIQSIQVQGYNATGFSSLSSPTSLVTKCAPVVKPVGTTSVFVEWTTSSNIAIFIEYKVYTNSTTVGPIVCSGKCNYTLTGLISGLIYTITVVDAARQPVTSSFQASVGAGLAAVTGLMVALTTGGAQLQWNAVQDASGYLVYVNQTSNAASYIISTSSLKVLIAIVCGMPYTFAVQAYSDVGYSDISPSIQLSSCLSSTSIPQALIIGVVIVAVLVLVASIFCGLGVWYACKNNSKDLGEVRSVSSIEGIPPTVVQETDFSRDGPATPVPASSCNYLRSHNITWDHHSNTLRDLERGGISV